MKLTELYKQTPVSRHAEIVVSGDRAFFENNEYLLVGDELVLIRDGKPINPDLAAIKKKLGI